MPSPLPLQALLLSKGTQLVPCKALQSLRPKWHPPWKLMQVISGHLGWVRCIAVDPSNEWFATGSGDRTIKVQAPDESARGGAVLSPPQLWELDPHRAHQGSAGAALPMMFALREREINPWKKIQDPAGIRTQDLLNTRQTLLPLSHSDPWQRSRRQAT